MSAIITIQACVCPRAEGAPPAPGSSQVPVPMSLPAGGVGYTWEIPGTRSLLGGVEYTLGAGAAYTQAGG